FLISSDLKYYCPLVIPPMIATKVF
ncbi:uncharacterized protein METZ01_LOCUS293443, partial [marine metagenome]